MNWLRRAPLPEWRTNASDSLNVLRLILAGGTVEAHGLPWGLAVLIAGRVVLRVIDALLAPRITFYTHPNTEEHTP